MLHRTRIVRGSQLTHHIPIMRGMFGIRTTRLPAHTVVTHWRICGCGQHSLTKWHVILGVCCVDERNHMCRNYGPPVSKVHGHALSIFCHPVHVNETMRGKCRVIPAKSTTATGPTTYERHSGDGRCSPVDFQQVSNFLFIPLTL